MEQPDITHEEIDPDEPVDHPADEAGMPGELDRAEGVEARDSGAGEAQDDFETGAVERVPADELEAEVVESTDEPETGNREPETSSSALARDIEAVLFISPEPVSLEVLAEVTGIGGDELAHAVEAVRARHSGPDSGIVFTELAGGYTFRASDQALSSVEKFCRRPVDYTLSAAAMETLAVVAYLQPITRPEIARIRGIGADSVVANLLDKGLLEEAGRSRQTGAVKYRTTRVFEKLFGLSGIDELPAIEGFDATPQDVEELRQKLHLAAEKRETA